MGCGFGYAERTECAIGWEGAMQACIQIYSIWIYLNKCYLFVIYAFVEGVFVFYLFKVDLNTIWIHSRQTRGDGWCKKGSNKSTSNMGIYSHHSLERSKSIVAETSKRGVDFGVRHRVGTHLGGQLEIWIHLNVFFFKLAAQMCAYTVTYSDDVPQAPLLAGCRNDNDYKGPC